MSSLRKLLLKVPKVIWEEGRVAGKVSHGVVAEVQSGTVRGTRLGVACIHEYACYAHGQQHCVACVCFVVEQSLLFANF